MPWKRETPMDQRIKLLGDWLSGRYSKTVLARRYEISRPTLDKWIARYEAEGAAGLEARSSAPHHSPQRTSEAVAQALIEEKLGRQDWGPKKLVHYLTKHRADLSWPAPSTAGEILDRAGLVERRPRRTRTPPYSQPFGDCEEPNAVWSVDYKGQFRTGDKQLCYPLTMTDNDTRYLLLCQGLIHPTLHQTRPWFEWVFREYGLPGAIRSDNGTPFASTGLAGLSALSVWWIKLGIVPERIAPGRPDQNGRHERMHRSLKAATLQSTARNQRDQQVRFNAFRAMFNEERPHESLAMETPASRYRSSPRPYPARLAAVEYGDAFEVRHVRSNGEIKWQGELLYVSQALIGEPVGLQQVEDARWALYFKHLHIAELNSKTGRFEPLKCKQGRRSKT